MARTLSSRLSNAPIRLKVVIISLMVSATTLLFAFALFALSQLTSYRQDHLDTLVSIAGITAYNISAPTGFNDVEGVTENYARIRQLEYVEMLQVLDEHGRLIAGYGLPDTSPPADNLYLQVSPAPDAADYAYVFHDSHLDLRVPVLLEGMRIGTLVLRSNLAPVHARFHSLLLIFGAVFIGSIFVACFVTTLLQRFISAPLLALRNTVELVKSTGDYSIRVPRTTNDETGVLISGFNSMLEEIRKRDDSLEQNRRNLEKTIHERTLDMAAALREITQEKDRAEQANQAKKRIPRHDEPRNQDTHEWHPWHDLPAG
jgi:methyl-accepting chemotaxis protein